jgi:hypothetical protein
LDFEIRLVHWEYGSRVQTKTLHLKVRVQYQAVKLNYQICILDSCRKVQFHPRLNK